MRETEISILKSAAKIFAERGYDKATLQQIADAVGIKKGSLYYYIQGKEDLLFRIADSMIEHWIKELRRVVHQPLEPQEKLREVIKAHVNLLAGDFERLCVFLHEYKSLKSEWRNKIVVKRDDYERLFENVIADGIEKGCFWPSDVKMVSLAILGMCNWLYQWYSSSGKLSIDEIASIFSNLILQGLLKPIILR